jgi:hypothetical protein
VTGDLYGWRWAVYHLAKAGRKSDLRRILVDFDYLLGKLDATSVNALIADYDYSPEDANLHTVQKSYGNRRTFWQEILESCQASLLAAFLESSIMILIAY